MNKEVFFERLEYDKKTGFLYKLDPWKKTRNGSRLGAADRDGYLVFNFLGTIYFVHRVVWLLETGKFPKNQIDHINGVRDDNRIENLRDVTNKENHRNRQRHSRKTGLMVGVTRNNGRPGWVVNIKACGKRKKYIGCFSDYFDACCARASAEIRYGYGV